MQKKTHGPPSKQKYDRAHPTVSVRVTDDLYHELEALRENGGRSLRDILKSAVEREKAGASFSVAGHSEVPMFEEGEKKRNTRTRRRAEIIKAAARLFAEKGYRGVTLDELAEQIGITKPALYQYIHSKEEILQEICKECLVTGFENWKRVKWSGLTPRDKLKSFIHGVVEGAAEGRDMMTVLFGDSNSLSPRVQGEVLTQRKAHDVELETLLREGVAAGQFEIRDIRLAAYAILGACLWVYQWYRPNGRLSPTEVAEGIIKLLEEGYLQKKAKKRRANTLLL
jgi:TetR/AcrR family transcriptional regulator, cholesterol catabolism regulator